MIGSKRTEMLSVIADANSSNDLQNQQSNVSTLLNQQVSNSKYDGGDGGDESSQNVRSYAPRNDYTDNGYKRNQSEKSNSEADQQEDIEEREVESSMVSQE